MCDQFVHYPDMAILRCVMERGISIKVALVEVNPLFYQVLDGADKPLFCRGHQRLVLAHYLSAFFRRNLTAGRFGSVHHQ